MVRMNYTQTPEHIVVTRPIREVDDWEWKMILAFRQQRRSGERCQWLVDPLRETMTPVEVDRNVKLGKY